MEDWVDFYVATVGAALSRITDATLEATLQRQKLNYRVFSTNVSIRGAKWSREQKN